MKISYNKCFDMDSEFLLLFSHTKSSVSIRALLTPCREGTWCSGPERIWNKRQELTGSRPCLEGGGSLCRSSVLSLLTREPGKLGQWCPRGKTGDKVLCSIVLGHCPVWGQPYQAPFSSGLMGVYGHRQLPPASFHWDNFTSSKESLAWDTPASSPHGHFKLFPNLATQRR